MLVTGYGSVTKTTFSNNVLNGQGCANFIWIMKERVFTSFNQQNILVGEDTDGRFSMMLIIYSTARCATENTIGEHLGVMI